MGCFLPFANDRIGAFAALLRRAAIDPKRSLTDDGFFGIFGVIKDDEIRIYVEFSSLLSQVRARSSRASCRESRGLCVGGIVNDSMRRNLYYVNLTKPLPTAGLKLSSATDRLPRPLGSEKRSLSS